MSNRIKTVVISFYLLNQVLEDQAPIPTEINEHKKIFVPHRLAWKIVKEAHDSIYYGKEGLCELLDRVRETLGIRGVTNNVMASCVQHTKNNNAYTRPLLPSPGKGAWKKLAGRLK